jgi:hypothetical protein
LTDELYERSGSLTEGCSVCAPVRTHDDTQQRSELAHFELAAALDDDAIATLRTLAAQFDGEQVVPLLGAGASYDCGMLLASQVARELHTDYLADPRFSPHPCASVDDLGAIAEAIFAVAGQRTVVDLLGLPDTTLWPTAEHIGAHFCAYRVLARLAREDLFDDAVTLNYDCHYEAGLRKEGWLLAHDVRGGRRFRDHVKVMSDASTAGSTAATTLALRKIHGCAQRFRTALAEGATAPEQDIVIRTDQLKDWTGREWAKERLRAIARENVMLMIGFSARDAVIVNELASLLGDVYGARPATGVPRIVAVDYDPATPELVHLVEQIGLNGKPLAVDRVAYVETRAATTTASLLVLLTEMLAHQLAPAFTTTGYSPPTEMGARLGALTLAAPTMLRWAFLLAPERGLNHPNLHRAGDDGYVPLRREPLLTARALRQRVELRHRLGLTDHESPAELLRNHGFVVAPGSGFAYLPTGLPDDELHGALRAAGPGGLVSRSLSTPAIDCVIIGEHRGFNLETSMEVRLP